MSDSLDDDWIEDNLNNVSRPKSKSKKKTSEKKKSKNQNPKTTDTDTDSAVAAAVDVIDYDDPAFSISSRDDDNILKTQKLVIQLAEGQLKPAPSSSSAADQTQPQPEPAAQRSYWRQDHHPTVVDLNFVHDKGLDGCGFVYNPDTEEHTGPFGRYDADSPPQLPKGLRWCQLDIEKDEEICEMHELLKKHYVTDESFWRFDLSLDCLRWGLNAPGAVADWHVGVRDEATNKLEACITGTPSTLRAHRHVLKTPIINFLCCSPRVRGRGLAPLLIDEISRRIYKRGIYNAIYTLTGVKHRPVAVVQWWHRSLNVKKLVEVGWIQLTSRETMQRTIRRYALPDRIQMRLQRLTPDLCASAHDLLKRYLKERRIARQFSREEFRHNFLPRDGVVDTYVRVDSSGKGVTELVSMYFIHQALLEKPRGHEGMKIACAHYMVTSEADGLIDLATDAMIIARNMGCDVYNMLDVMDNATLFAPLKFDEGDAPMNYHIYNWRCPAVEASDIGVVLL